MDGESASNTSDIRLQDETARVEDVLLEREASEQLAAAFVKATGVSFEGVLDPYVTYQNQLTSGC